MGGGVVDFLVTDLNLMWERSCLLSFEGNFVTFVK